ncbi:MULTISPECIES: type II toxin-antitoxin system mRNA interferase toxin, RelE/StbE family [Azotobacter]|uniref:type II toxin-antitoxin system mRNA interferase toxin, RelE/StbE family n=1 Tax=Azotobacter TaxID=352 RepID=UPI000930B271
MLRRGQPEPQDHSREDRQPSDARYRDHGLSGDWAGYRECHVKPDLPGRRHTTASPSFPAHGAQ